MPLVRFTRDASATADQQQKDSAQSRSAHDMLASSTRLRVLKTAEHDLDDLCASIKTPHEREACFAVLNYYHTKRTKVQSACERELTDDGKPGRSCAALDSMAHEVFQLSCSGGVKNIYKVFAVERRLQERRRVLDSLALSVSADSSSTGACMDSSARETAMAVDDGANTGNNAHAVQLFAAVDKNGDGVIDREEFLEAFKLLHRRLDEDEMGRLFLTLDIHGHVTMEQFTDIMAAEELFQLDSDAEFLRHLHITRPGWWTDCPAALDRV